jgi:hypothetical protein
MKHLPGPLQRPSSAVPSRQTKATTERRMRMRKRQTKRERRSEQERDTVTIYDHMHMARQIVPLLFLWRQGSLIFQLIPHLLASFDQSSLQLGYGRGEGARVRKTPVLSISLMGTDFLSFWGIIVCFFSSPSSSFQGKVSSSRHQKLRKIFFGFPGISQANAWRSLRDWFTSIQAYTVP